MSREMRDQKYDVTVRELNVVSTNSLRSLMQSLGHEVTIELARKSDFASSPAEVYAVKPEPQVTLESALRDFVEYFE